jgi:pyruvate dehydrogenase E1 component alpha subunit
MDRPLALKFYREMLLIRRFEEKAAEMYALGKIGGFCHLYIGQEAVAVGAVHALRPDDYVISSYREHGHALAKGVDPNAVMAELFGKATGVSKGKGGSMHLFDVARRFMGGWAIVGAHLALATGIAFAIKYRNEDPVVMCFFGEGAVPSGTAHEALNIAALWKLPVVFVCENNRYGMGTPVERAAAIYDITRTALAYDMDHASFDGMDVLETHARVSEAVAKVRRDRRPIFLEARTYRFMGHSMADPAHGHYRTKQELEEQKRRDPLVLHAERLKRDGAADAAALAAIEQEVDRVVKQAIAFADASPEPPPGALFEDVFA